MTILIYMILILSNFWVWVPNYAEYSSASSAMYICCFNWEQRAKWAWRYVNRNSIFRNANAHELRYLGCMDNIWVLLPQDNLKLWEVGIRDLSVRGIGQALFYLYISHIHVNDGLKYFELMLPLRENFLCIKHLSYSSCYSWYTVYLR